MLLGTANLKIEVKSDPSGGVTISLKDVDNGLVEFSVGPAEMSEASAEFAEKMAEDYHIETLISNSMK